MGQWVNGQSVNRQPATPKPAMRNKTINQTAGQSDFPNGSAYRS